VENLGKLSTAGKLVPAAYIRSIVDAVEVDDRAVRIIGSKEVLQAVIAGKQNTNGNVRVFVRKWRATVDKDGHYSFAVAL
jgi:site-specific DNA recombinase